MSEPREPRKRPHLLLICGPTASGKTGLATKLAARFRTEIISADSIQIYRGLDVGSAKPTPEELAAAPHHLIDIVDPQDSYSVGQYKRDFERCLEERFLKESPHTSLSGQVSMGDPPAFGERSLKGDPPAFSERLFKRDPPVPIVCGGTGLYFNAILYDYDFAGAAGDENLREHLRKRGEQEGWEKLFAELARIDPETAAAISPRDEKRIVRALEIFMLTGKRRSNLKPKLTDRYTFTVAGLNYERELLYKTIDNRVLCMFANGLVEEVEHLLSQGVDETRQCMQAIGYRETLAYLRGRKTREETISDIQRATRNYAKRQITWFKRIPGIRWLDPREDGAADLVQRWYREDADEMRGYHE